MFFKILSGVKDENGNFISGYCTLCDSKYKRTGKKNHCDQIEIEYLGKILFIDKARTYGKFKSKTRGYFTYDLTTDTFSKLDLNDEHIVEKEKTELKVSTVFGDGYLLTELLKKSQIFSPLKATFCKNKVFERVFIHILHSLGKCGQDIDCCDYARKSFLSYLIPDIGLSSLETDTAYFKFMADPNIKLEFFKNFIAEMRKTNKDFGKVCYLDSTPIPNEVKSMMLNYFCTHGTNTAAMQVRLALLLDEETGYPVWFDVIPGNVSDGKTLVSMFDFVTEELELEVNDLVLDCGYCTKDNLLHFKSGSLANFLVRMPDRKGYSMDAMYYRHFSEFIQARYSFVREGHSYYGRRVEKELWGEKFYAFIYVDKYNAQIAFAKYLEEHEEEFENMKLKEKNKKEFEGGYFVLLMPFTSENEKLTPKEVLNKYLKRTDIETFFKTAKNYVSLLPICKECPDAILGKIFNDAIATIFRMMIQDKMSEKQRKKGIPKCIGQMQSLICKTKKDGSLMVEIPNKQASEVMKEFKITVPSRLNVEEYRNNLLPN